MECTRNSKVLKLTRYVNVSRLLDTSFANNLNPGTSHKYEIQKIILNKLSKPPPNLLIGETLMFRDFGIIRKPYISWLWKYKNGEVSVAWNIPITNKKEISILYNKIGIPLEEKREKVANVISSYIR